MTPSPPLALLWFQHAGVPKASDIFYISLLGIFLTGIVSALVNRLTRDKCLKLLHGYHVTLEKARGQSTWGTLKVFSSGMEVAFGHAYADHRGRKRTSLMVYEQEIDTSVLALLRYEGELDGRAAARRRRQVGRTFNPGPVRRLVRRVRSGINTLRDTSAQSISSVVGQYQKLNPTDVLVGSGGAQVSQLGQTLLSRFNNAYEPLLEQHIGQPVILEVADPVNSNTEVTEYTGYLAEYTQRFIAVFAVSAEVVSSHTLTLPDIGRGEYLPPLPPPPAPGSPRVELPPPLLEAGGVAVRVDGFRLRLYNTHHHAIVLRQFDRPGLDPYRLEMTIPPHGYLEMPAPLAKGATVRFDVVVGIDVVAPRKYATIRHAGETVARRGLFDAMLDLHLGPLQLRHAGRRVAVDDPDADDEGHDGDGYVKAA